jgi:hypothetical protein
MLPALLVSHQRGKAACMLPQALVCLVLTATSLCPPAPHRKAYNEDLNDRLRQALAMVNDQFQIVVQVSHCCACLHLTTTYLHLLLAPADKTSQ